MRKKLLFGTLFAVLFVSCNNNTPNTQEQENSNDFTKIETPVFNADSAYYYVQKQLSFGPRIPNSSAQKECAKYLISTMKQWVDTVIVQNFSANRWDEVKLSGTNIISSINPEASNRILLAAHWDSRAYADRETDPQKQHQPILGANDGASGVATLMEIARIMKQQKPTWGVDIIFFDLEDQGVPEFENSYKDDSWCLGSQYWVKNPHKLFYQANYGILFDMVGGFNPRFTKEEVSRHYASGITDKIWLIAKQLGYENIFENTETDAILDDHLYINQNIGIPTTDIVENQRDCSFFKYWHTQNDNLDAIDKKTMKIVADVVLKVIYSEN